MNNALRPLYRSTAYRPAGSARALDIHDNSSRWGFFQLSFSSSASGGLRLEQQTRSLQMTI